MICLGFIVWFETTPILSGLQPGDIIIVKNMKIEERLTGGFDWDADGRVSFHMKGIPLNGSSMKYLIVNPEYGTQAQGGEGELWEVEFVKFVDQNSPFSSTFYLVGKWMKVASIRELPKKENNFFERYLYYHMAVGIFSVLTCFYCVLGYKKEYTLIACGIEFILIMLFIIACIKFEFPSLFSAVGVLTFIPVGYFIGVYSFSVIEKYQNRRRFTEFKLH